MGYSLSELQEVLDKFGGIEYERRPANFFEIINGTQSHHEKYISNALAFFSILAKAMGWVRLYSMRCWRLRTYKTT